MVLLVEKYCLMRYTLIMAIYKQDDIVTLLISGYGASGEGVAKKDGFTFFVPFVLVDETITVKINHVNKKGLIFASVKEILNPSPLRVKPPCNRFTRCGGCDMMHIDYKKQLEIKRDNIVNLLRKNAGIEFPVDETVPCSSPYEYRNKIQLPFGEVNGKVAVGFFKENSHKIVSITKCFLHGVWVEKLIEVFLDFANQNKLSAYNDMTKRGLLRHMVARQIDGQYCIVVVTNNNDLPKSKELCNRLIEKIGDNFALYVSIKKTHDNVILGEKLKVIKSREIEVDILGIKCEINPYSFLQLNNEIRDKIYSKVINNIMEKSSSPIVLDAYAGVGAIGAVMAKRGARVYNIEIVPEATKDGDKLASKNGISDKVTNICGDASIVLPELIKYILGNQNDENKSLKSIISQNVSIILDPPRKGCDERVLKAITELECEYDLYYISCNPATLTRDLKILCESGKLKLNSITPYDMFPQTKHVETLVVLSHKKPDGHISVNVEFGEEEGQVSLKDIEKRAKEREPKKKITYKDIQAYIEEKYGFKVHTAYIAEVKRDLGLPIYDAPNAVEELKKPRQHPTEKMVEAIKDALKHFEII